MRNLQRPQFNSSATIDRCIKSIQSKDLKDRLMLIKATVESAEVDYIINGDRQTLYTIPRSPDIDGLISVTEMKRVYKDTFVRSKRTRDIYDHIKKLPQNDICPLCSQRIVGTLDHYLPQSLHATFSITPINLIPSCIDCNKAKLDGQPTSANEQTLHPYFDLTDDAIWLKAVVKECAPGALRFFPEPPTEWNDTKRSRLLSHFRKFNLGSLYASHSGAELTNIRYGLQRIAKRGTHEDIRDELIHRLNSCSAAHLNSWQTAMYRALSESQWFCSGGFNAE